MSILRTVEKKDNFNNRYKKYYLTRNPFPIKPGIQILSSDDRENGEIYLPELRTKETSQFESLVIPKAEGKPTRCISLLMDNATRQGRGIGKSSFLYYQFRRINKDWGEDITKDSEVMFATYCAPNSSESYRRFYSLSRLIINNLIEQNVLSIAVCRLRIMTSFLDERIYDEVTETNLLETVGDYSWLKNKYNDLGMTYLSEHDLQMAVKRTLEKLDIKNPKLVDRLSRFGYNATDLSKYFTSEISESEWRSSGNTLLFDDIVTILKASGFTKGIILCDELEKIIVPLSAQERRAFCEELRYWFLDGTNENAKVSFFNILLVIHPYLQEILNPYWSSSGLERFTSLGGELTHTSTILFEPITVEQAIPLAKEYLKKSREAGYNADDSLFPFTEESLTLASNKCSNIPGKFLALLHNAIEDGVEKDVEHIEESNIKDLLSKSSISEGQTESKVESIKNPKINL
ncbi:hypothetical protein [Sphingobacterium spiritivorum]|uniref:hypothetical protein n=1 Tax=Sphingobacterium spiritivorum TaxID=258 RepID=UPI00191B3A5D|nr:hypothetical protein [Sphingobacterium spiritivorum]QQT27635.1 hypothetical protein I6J02_07270 [Sphingobacterium spiritivorum]